MEAIARGRYIRISPLKVRKVAKIIRNKNYNEAEAYLNILPNKAAKILLKVLKSAKANYINLTNNEPKDLYIKKLLVDQAPIMKRVMPRARGRADILKKQSSHITIVLDDKEKK